ncbi:MAG: segregation/condensation protein A [Clostridia bacterium]|nr:segregation/condensation protein A [Clostridia bacterium]
MEAISYKVEVFEGPLDLLLHLISKHKLDIYDIPIVELVDQYIAYVRSMEEENLYVASEFIEMAARLVYIKSVSLLPVYEEAEELKRELSGELIEYRDCQLIAGKLAEHTDGFDRFVREAAVLPVDHTYTRLHDESELLKAYLAAVGKKLRNLPPPVEAFREIVSKKIVSVSSKFKSIFTKLKRAGKKQKLYELMNDADSKSDMVAVFLAILELAKSRKIDVVGEGADVDIKLLSDDIMDLNSEEWE